jgi:hypothetical protein
VWLGKQCKWHIKNSLASEGVLHLGLDVLCGYIKFTIANVSNLALGFSSYKFLQFIRLNSFQAGMKHRQRDSSLNSVIP